MQLRHQAGGWTCCRLCGLRTKMSLRLACSSDSGLPMGQSSLGASLILSFGPDFGYFGFVCENNTRVPRSCCWADCHGVFKGERTLENGEGPPDGTTTLRAGVGPVCRSRAPPPLQVHNGPSGSWHHHPHHNGQGARAPGTSHHNTPSRQAAFSLMDCSQLHLDWPPVSPVSTKLYFPLSCPV